MQVNILGSAGSEAPGVNPPAFLIDDFLLLDAGTVSLTLDQIAQCRLTHIFLTHAHLDHLKMVLTAMKKAEDSDALVFHMMSGREKMQLLS